VTSKPEYFLSERNPHLLQAAQSGSEFAFAQALPTKVHRLDFLHLHFWPEEQSLHRIVFFGFPDPSSESLHPLHEPYLGDSQAFQSESHAYLANAHFLLHYLREKPRGKP
jgi:hypothetical protein